MTLILTFTCDDHGAVEYAYVPIIDFSKAHTPAGRAELPPQVRDAMHRHSFMRIANRGVAQAQNDRILDIADAPFSAVPDDELSRFLSKVRGCGMWKRYKPRQFWHIDNGVRDQTQGSSMVLPALEQKHPATLHPLLPEIHAFMEYNHFHGLYSILGLLALGLELPEETVVEQHRFDARA